MTKDKEALQRIVEETDHIVFFGGAGVSTESNIPDFRSEDGIYHAVDKYGYPPEMILSHTFFKKNPEVFYQYLRENLYHLEARPNGAHIALANWEKQGKLKAIVTQNIDGLHQLAGSKNVFELHGSLLRNHCVKCNKKFELSYILQKDNIPLCDHCNGIVRPDIVLYEEGLNQEVLRNAVEAINAAEVLIVGGTSLSVYPAAGLLQYFHGRHLVLINKTTTPYDSQAEIVIRDPIGKTLENLSIFF